MHINTIIYGGLWGNEVEYERFEEENEINLFDCSNLEKCEECDEESYNKNLCIKCNNEKNYYYLNYMPAEPRNKYIDCVNEMTKPARFYFNVKKKDYEPCSTYKYNSNNTCFKNCSNNTMHNEDLICEDEISECSLLNLYI